MSQINFDQYFTALDSVNLCLQKRDELSNSGLIAELKAKILEASKSDKKTLGQELNSLKKSLTQSCDKRIKEIQALKEKDNFTDFDPTFFYSELITKRGQLHPVTQVTREIVEIFEKLGFIIADGPLVENQEYCFTKLNLPDYHPARAMQDTFYLKQKDQNAENYVLRTHTSGVQIRYGQDHSAPIKIVAPGQVYRNENIDATHDIMFHQIECLVVEKRVSLAHLKTLIEQFYKEFFGDSSLKARLRPSYFPYTIPSMEVDISNPFKDDPKSKLYRQDWIEVGGSGLVHPEVIKNIGLDPKEWQGFAFGFGLDRMAQLKLGISKMNQFFNGHLDFLEGSD